MKRDPLQIARSRELRQTATTAESIVWRELRNRRFAGFKFRRQQPFGPFILDFYCARLAFAIEPDGDSHMGRESSDLRRQRWLEAQGVQVLRIFNVDVYENLDGVMEQIDRECLARAESRFPDPAGADRRLLREFADRNAGPPLPAEREEPSGPLSPPGERVRRDARRRKISTPHKKARISEIGSSGALPPHPDPLPRRGEGTAEDRATQGLRGHVGPHREMETDRI